MRKALLGTLLKPVQTPYQCLSYRPLLLLNFAMKMYAKTKPTDWLRCCQWWWHQKSGFIPGRSLTLSLCTLFGAMQHIDPAVWAAAVFLDAGKEFDLVEWGFMFATLRNIGVGDILQIVTVLFTQRTARIRVNDIVTTPTDITRGAR
ncbi:hypothetical protein NDU88_004155 [Pleurodeles waltl]|uniref:Reverse transcriptase domain-containing protein n=1 Tax=Pleurodeles waltl TaxID=8319 RepID=A0AAV7NIP1_PLEWA|nr:hypothetical protein NDU88_004155 [Pleurodeles waltl]